MRAAERIHTLERALQVRHWARGRKTDEMVLPFFEQLDREQFKAVMDEFYVLQGWDIESGWPARERLCELGLPDVYETIVGGATEAEERSIESR